MTGRSHLIFGTVTAAAYLYTVQAGALPHADLLAPTVAVPALAAGLCIFGSILPDIDHPKSMVGKMFPAVSGFIEHWCGIRSYPHDLLLWLPFSVFCLYRCPVLFGLCVGVFSHLFLDGWTVMGIPVGYLFNKRRLHFMPVKALRISAQGIPAKLLTLTFSFGLVFFAFPQVRVVTEAIAAAVVSIF